MTKDTWVIIGTLGGLIVVLGGVIINQNSQLMTRIDNLDASLSRQNDRIAARVR